MAGYVVALTGASGAKYGLRLLEELLRRGDDADLIISPSGFLILEEEIGLALKGKDVEKGLKAVFKGAKGALRYCRNEDLTASAASGSSVKKAMIICPCSMGTLARVATGASGSLIERAADCFLKERRPLVLVPRETPLNSIHLENMLKLSRMGAVILPAMPAFYSKPESIDDMVDFVVGKTLDVLGIENSLYKRWTK